MELVINIPEEDWKYLKESDGCRWSRAIIEGVINGTPLPKGHGDLIDRRELKKEVYTTTEWNGDVHRIIYEASIDDAKPIIEADKDRALD